MPKHIPKTTRVGYNNVQAQSQASRQSVQWWQHYVNIYSEKRSPIMPFSGPPSSLYMLLAPATLERQSGSAVPRSTERPLLRYPSLLSGVMGRRCAAGD